MYLEKKKKNQNENFVNFKYHHNINNFISTFKNNNLISLQNSNFKYVPTTYREALPSSSPSVILLSQSNHTYARSLSSLSWDYKKRCTKIAVVTIVTFVLFNCLAGINNVIEAFDLHVLGNAYSIAIGNLLVCLNRLNILL